MSYRLATWWIMNAFEVTDNSHSFTNHTREVTEMSWLVSLFLSVEVNVSTEIHVIANIYITKVVNLLSNCVHGFCDCTEGEAEGEEFLDELDDSLEV